MLVVSTPQPLSTETCSKDNVTKSVSCLRNCTLHKYRQTSLRIKILTASKSLWPSAYRLVSVSRFSKTAFFSRAIRFSMAWLNEKHWIILTFDKPRTWSYRLSACNVISCSSVGKLGSPRRFSFRKFTADRRIFSCNERAVPVVGFFSSSIPNDWIFLLAGQQFV